jgi:hypothetical protein
MKLGKTTRNALLGALAFTLAPTAALAVTTPDTTYQGEDDGFDWGLLGLLGLAGLLGLKRNDDAHGGTRR